MTEVRKSLKSLPTYPLWKSENIFSNKTAKSGTEWGKDQEERVKARNEKKELIKRKVS